MTDRREYELKDFIFDLPDDLIAQHPEVERDTSRLFVVQKKSQTFIHKRFTDLHEFIAPGDVMVMNNVKVIPARIYTRRISGGTVEIILTRKLSNTRWHIVCNRTKRIQPGEILYAKENQEIRFKVLEKSGGILLVDSNIELSEEILLSIGNMPLPPYIQRKPDEDDYTKYQTVYASEPGAAASPTAGLHFTESLIDDLKNRGVDIVFLTLYVSWGTFQPVRSENISSHQMHTESYILTPQTASTINRARKESRRIIAVGTTSLRVLESTYENGENQPGKGETDIFIYPPYNVQSADALVTNFHTPGSTLLMLVSAFGGYDTIMSAYKIAIEKGYRFFSYGDAMLIIS